MTAMRTPRWSWIAPLDGIVLLAVPAFLAAYLPAALIVAAQAAVLIACVLAAVHHAEVVAHRVGEPLGTVLLALAVTVIEAGLIVSLMLSGGDAAASLARDTVFASIMIILNGMIGLCLVVGALCHGEQSFSLYGVNATLATLAAIAVITLVLPNMTTSAPGPGYTIGQLAFVAVVVLVLYGAFVLVQTVRKRDYFLPADAVTEPASSGLVRPGAVQAGLSGTLLIVCLSVVILLAKALAPVIEAGIDQAHAPKAVVGVVIALIVLLPESLAALNAARANKLQTSLNLALGSAMASIGLTIPAVAAVSIATGWTLNLGLDSKGALLLGLSLLVATLSLGTGRTIALQGIVHLVLFAVYLFVTVVP